MNFYIMYLFHYLRIINSISCIVFSGSRQKTSAARRRSAHTCTNCARSVCATSTRQSLRTRGKVHITTILSLLRPQERDECDMYQREMNLSSWHVQTAQRANLLMSCQNLTYYKPTTIQLADELGKLEPRVFFYRIP